MRIGDGALPEGASAGHRAEVEVDPYRIYLQGELARLRAPEVAREFYEAAGAMFRPRWRLGNSGRKIRRRLPDQAAVDAFVENVSPADARELGEICSRWRDNSVADKIERAGRAHWTIRTVPTDDVEVDQAESTAVLSAAFALHDYRLVPIARDTVVLAQPPYSEHQTGELVAQRVLLAIAHPERLRIFDGIHRAIQLVRNGERQLEICAPSR